MKFSKILTVVLLVSVLAISLIACSTSKNNKDEKQSIDSSISTLMATEPNSADEASKLYNQLMEKENEILSTDKALWEKVFMASNKDNPMIEDGTNYGDFLLKTIEGAKDQFTDEEYKKLVAGAEQIKEIEGKLTILEQKYPECANAPSNGDSVPADSNGVISNSGGATSFPSFDGKDLDGNDIKSSDFFKSNNVRPIFNPPPVLPAQAPRNISASRIPFEKLGHRSKSVVANPVVVITVATWKAACRTVSPSVE